MAKMIRQGDVMLQRIDSIPKKAKEIKRGVASLVLAEGEVTGHAHVIKDRLARLFGDGDNQYVKLEQPATLEHEEHSAHCLEAGSYRLIHQREYSPEAIRNVAD
jgi:hypothetical protein